MSDINHNRLFIVCLVYYGIDVLFTNGKVVVVCTLLDITDYVCLRDIPPYRINYTLRVGMTSFQGMLVPRDTKNVHK